MCRNSCNKCLKVKKPAVWCLKKKGCPSKEYIKATLIKGHSCDYKKKCHC